MRAMVWFRSDLRVRDNPALAAACADASRGVVGVFAVCPEQWAEHDWGPPRVGFLLRALRDLSVSLDRLNIPLRIVTTPRFDGAPAAMDGLAASLACDAIYFSNEYEINERRRDDAVERRFAQAGRAVRRFDGRVILPPGSVRTKAGGMSRVFTPFRRAWLARLDEEGGVSTAARPDKQPERPCPPDPIPDRVAGFDPGDDPADHWPATERAAHDRLGGFIEDRLSAYHEARDAPAADGTSRLSPYLTHGLISPGACLAAALEAGGASALAKPGTTGPSAWISELVWREFYIHLLAAHPRLSMGRAFQPVTERLTWSDDDEAFDAWREGRTGYPIVDAAMRCLTATGWMHNRLRMVVAMFLTKDLWIDWRRGEAHFMRRLVDGDLASNNGGWQWSASTGTDAAPYFRIYNPTTQGERHDPDARFIKTWLPELADLDVRPAHDPSRLPPPARRRLGYPEPICDHAERRERAIAAFKALGATPTGARA